LIHFRAWIVTQRTQLARTPFHEGVTKGKHHGIIVATHKLTFRVAKEDTMLDALQSLLMIGTPTQTEGGLWTTLMVGGLAAAAVLRRISRD